MKKILFIAVISLSAFFSKAQSVSVTINNVTPGNQGSVKGDFVTFTVDAPNAYVWGVNTDVTIDGVINGGGGLDTYNADKLFSHKVNTYTKFFGLKAPSMNKTRVWVVRVMYTPDGYTPDSSDPCFAVSEPYTVSK